MHPGTSLRVLRPVSAFEMRVQFPGASVTFFAGQQNQKPEVATGPLAWGLLATIPCHPDCLATLVREASLSGIGVHSPTCPPQDFPFLPAAPASCPPRLACAERTEQRASGQGPNSQHSHFPSQLWDTTHPNFQPKTDFHGESCLLSVMSHRLCDVTPLLPSCFLS